MSKTPTTLIIMDGFGLRDAEEGNAVKNARTPHLDRIFAENPGCRLSASGLDVGLPVCLADIGVENISPEELRQVAEKASIPEESTHAMPFPVNAQTVAAAIVAADKLGSTYKQERAK